MKVAEKKVEQIELFYDLIYVYAISKLTLLIEEPVAGVIPLPNFISYIVACLVVLQSWLYLTNYVNRYGSWTWYEYLLTAVNMVAAVYTANTISPQWDEMSLAFNISMLVMLVCVAAQYLIQVRLKAKDTAAAKNSLTILSVVCALYLVASILSAIGGGEAVIWLDIAAVLAGAFLPFFIRGHFDISIINFPHLVERFGLLVIVTFGEAVVGIAGFFDTEHMTLQPIFAFALILTLFACYETQLHRLGDRDRSERALRLMFSHYFIVIAINLITVALTFLRTPTANRLFTAFLMTGSLALFFVSIFANSAYYKKGYRFQWSDAFLALCSLLVGAAIMCAAGANNLLFLMGTLVASLGVLAMLQWKLRHPDKSKTIKEQI